MKKLAITLILTTMSIFGFAQDWFGYNVYKADNERIIIAMCNIAKANGIVPIISSIPPCKEFPWRKEIKSDFRNQ